MDTNERALLLFYQVSRGLKHWLRPQSIAGEKIIADEKNIFILMSIMCFIEQLQKQTAKWTLLCCISVDGE